MAPKTLPVPLVNLIRPNQTPKKALSLVRSAIYFLNMLPIQKLFMRYFTFFFCPQSLQSRVYFTLTTHSNLNTKLSSEIFNLYLDFITFTV